MSQSIRGRFQTNVRFTANNDVQEELRRGFILRELYVDLRAIISAATGNAVTPANTRPGDLFGMIKRIEIIANGTDTLRSYSGEQLRWLNYYQHNAGPRLGALQGGVAADTQVECRQTAIIPFWMPKARRALDTALDTTLLSDLRVRVSWGDITSVTSATGAAFVGEPQLNIHSLESFGVQGPFAQSRVFRIENRDVQAQDEYEVDLPVSGAVYRGFLIQAKDANGNDIADAIDNVRLKSGTNVFYDLPGSVLQDVSVQRDGVTVQRDADSERGVFVSEESRLNGQYFLDLVTDGFLTEALDSLGLAELIVELKVNQTIANLTVLPLSIIPIRKSG